MYEARLLAGDTKGIVVFKLVLLLLFLSQGFLCFLFKKILVWKSIQQKRSEF